MTAARRLLAPPPAAAPPLPLRPWQCTHYSMPKTNLEILLHLNRDSRRRRLAQLVLRLVMVGSLGWQSKRWSSWLAQQLELPYMPQPSLLCRVVL